MVGFDFSMSNRWTGEKSYHYSLHDADYLNPYLHIIQILEPIIPKFDDDCIIPAYRFGCDDSKDKCVVALNYPDVPDPNFNGFGALKQGYLQAVYNVKMSGPATFAVMCQRCNWIGRRLLRRQIIQSASAQSVSVMVHSIR